MSADPTRDLLSALKLEPEARTPRRARWPWVLLLAGIGAAAAAWWSYAQRPLPVRTALAVAPTPDAGGARAVLEASGYVTARRQATVASKVTGRVQELLLEEGDTVRAGQILARLDATDANAALALAKAQRDAAAAQLQDIALQIAQAKRDHRRQQELATRKLAPPQSVEDARLKLDSLTAREAVQRRQVAVAERNVGVAEVGVENTIIRAPFDGVVTDKAAQPGEIVSPISAGGGFTRTGIGTLVDMSSLEIEVDVNEAYLSRVQPGQAVKAVLNAYPDWQLPAHVITLIPTADRAKATVKARIAIDLQDRRIVPDMGVRVSFLEDTAAAPAKTGARHPQVPAVALREEGDRSLLFVVQDGAAHRREVVTGQREGDLREITQGLTAGERVILAPPANLRDGQRVADEAR